jgi:MFS family permease
VAGVLPGFLTASLATRIGDDFAFGGFELGMTIAVFYAVSALSSPPAGRLVDRTGAATGVRLAAVTTALCCVATALLADSAAALGACLVLGGVGNAVGGPAVSALLRRSIAGGRHGLAFGVQQAGAPLGALVAGLALPAVAIPFGWRWAFAATAVLAIAVAAAATARAPASDAVAGRRAAHERPARAGAVRLIGAAAVLASAAGVGMVSFLVLFAVEEGMSESAAGLTLGAVSLAAAISRIVLGWAADRRAGDPLLITAAMLAASALGYVVIATGSPAAIVAGAVLVGTVGWSWPGTFQLAVVGRAPEAPAWAVGVMLSGLFVGAVAGPLIVGVLADAGEFAGAWAVCGSLAIAAALVTVAAVRRDRRAGLGTRTA